MRPDVAPSVDGVRAHVARWRAAGERVALVPTMGALHEGHLSLVRRARQEADRAVVSIFVNPAQFAPTEDFSTYPRTFEPDLELLSGVATDLVYAPTAAVMYPEGFATRINVAGPAEAGLEDLIRPHFFAGVATVVAKLFAQCMPDVAIFGEKDYQQLRVVTQMVGDLDMPVRVVGAATVREADGLAMSSRNRYLSAIERDAAAALPDALRHCAGALRGGVPLAAALAEARAALERAGFSIDYLALRDAATLAPVSAVAPRPCRLLVAARLGTTRLIDNVAV